MDTNPAFYRGIEFRSPLAASYALSFDHFKIEWAYKFIGFEVESQRLLPEFWLPKIMTYLVVRAPFPARLPRPPHPGRINERANWQNAETLVVIGDELGTLRLAEDDSRVGFARCQKCGRHWLMPWYLAFICRGCGEFDGDHYVNRYEDRFPLRPLYRESDGSAVHAAAPQIR